MGLEYEEIRLVEVYSKTDQTQKKIVQRYGQQFICRNHVIKLNPKYKEPVINEEEEREEENLLDEQKRFQSLHDTLQMLKEKYNKTTEQISELFVRVCGDLSVVERALKGEKVEEWTYLEDLALSKPQDSSEF